MRTEKRIRGMEALLLYLENDDKRKPIPAEYAAVG